MSKYMQMSKECMLCPIMYLRIHTRRKVNSLLISVLVRSCSSRRHLDRLADSQDNMIVTNEPCHEKTCLRWFSTRADTNEAVHPQKMAGGLKFWFRN